MIFIAQTRLYTVGNHTVNFDYDDNGYMDWKAVYAWDGDTTDIGDYSLSMDYDDNGNMTKRVEYAYDGSTVKVLDYTYDEDDRMTKVEEGATVVAQYRYGPFGRRVLKDTGADETVFSHDRDMIGEADIKAVILGHEVNEVRQGGRRPFHQ